MESFLQLRREQGHFFCLNADLAAEPQRIADHELHYLILADYAVQLCEVGALVFALDSIEALRGNSQSIGDSDTDPARTDVERKNTPANGWKLKGI